MLKKILLHISTKRRSSSIFWRSFFICKDKIWFWAHNLTSYFVRVFRMRQRLKVYTQVDDYAKISFCITCMNRLSHLERTLLRNIKNNSTYPDVEFILLDYNSQDGLQDWVGKNCKKYIKKGILKYHRIEWPTSFHMANAKNIAHNLGTGDVLCGLDADNFTNKNFAFYINFEFNKNKNIIGHCSGRRSDFGGRMFFSKSNFEKLGGYDEDFVGWGYEDIDFKHRAFELGLTPVSIPNFFLNSIQHSDELRYKNMAIPQEEAERRNKELFTKKRQEATTLR